MNAPKAHSSSASRLTTDAPKAHSSSASRLTTDAPKIHSSSARRVNDDPTAVNPTRAAGQKSEKPMAGFSLPARGHVQQQDLSSVKTDSRKLIGGISDKAKADAVRGEQRGPFDRKKKIDLSRLEKKLGVKHIALINALRDVDPESPHGQELAAIIESLAESSG